MLSRLWLYFSLNNLSGLFLWFHKCAQQTKLCKQICTIYTFWKLILGKMDTCQISDLYIDRLLYKILYHCQRQLPVMFDFLYGVLVSVTKCIGTKIAYAVPIWLCYNYNFIFRHSTRKSPTRRVIKSLVVSEIQRQTRIYTMVLVINNFLVPLSTMNNIVSLYILCKFVQ